MGFVDICSPWSRFRSLEVAGREHEYVAHAGLSGGPLFRARLDPRSEDEDSKGRSVYTPHSLRATAPTLLLKSGVDILDVQELLGHKSVITTQIYDKRERQTRDSASRSTPSVATRKPGFVVAGDFTTEAGDLSSVDFRRKKAGRNRVVAE